MKAEKIYTIASIATFFALLPALIYMEVRVIRMLPDYNFLIAVIVIMNVLLLAFMGLEIFLLIRKWKKEKNMATTQTVEKTVISKEWYNEDASEKTSGEEI
ncbi:MAG: hypothetical protein ACFFDW_17580 [Candidatus Thorarchaeota archaeon]